MRARLVDAAHSPRSVPEKTAWCARVCVLLIGHRMRMWGQTDLLLRPSRWREKNITPARLPVYPLTSHTASACRRAAPAPRGSPRVAKHDF